MSKMSAHCITIQYQHNAKQINDVRQKKLQRGLDEEPNSQHIDKDICIEVNRENLYN